MTKNGLKGLTKFRAGTINALGHSHTEPGGNKPGWLRSAARTALLVLVILKRRLGIVCLQEFQAPQQKVFREKLGKLYGIYASGDNAVVWLKQRWNLIDAGTISIPYFDGHMKAMPWVLLKHKKTGKQLYVLSKHNPANVNGPALKWRKQGWETEGDWAHRLVETKKAKVLIGGDANDRLDDYGPYVHKYGGKIAGNDRLWGIDFLIGFGGLKFTRFKSSRTARIKKMTDHPVVQAVGWL